MTGARHFRAERERGRRTAIRTARAVTGASYMARQEARPHVPDGDSPVCAYCGTEADGFPGEPVWNSQDCPGRKPG